MALSADSILKHAGSYETAVVHVPAWKDENGDDAVIVRGMTIREFEVHQATTTREAEAANRDGKAVTGLATARVIARCCITSDGGRLFRDEQAQTIAELPMRDTAKLSAKIFDLSGMNDDDDEISGNSDAAPGGSSTSD